MHLAGQTTHPDGRWVTQQARNLSLSGALEDVRFPVRDRDSRFVARFDEVFRDQIASVDLSTSLADQAVIAA